MAEPVSVALAASAAASSAVVAAAEPGFLMAAAGFILGWGWVALAILVILGIMLESHSSTGWAVFTGLLTATLAFFFFKLSLVSLAIGVAVYVPIGLFWSWYRYKRHAAKEVERARNMSVSQKEMIVKGLHPKAMLGTIVQWILIWPFSIVENLIGDLIHAIESLVTKWFRGVYHTIYDSAVKSILGS